jgi:guanylate kinase
MNEKTHSKEGIFFSVTGLSGSGKDAICDALLKQDKKLSFLISSTTRAKRAGEVEGEKYHFFDKQTFQKLIKQGAFAEWVTYNDDYYGVLKSDIEDNLQNGFDILGILTWEGVEELCDQYRHMVHLLIMPPSVEALENRLLGRAGATAEDSQIINERIQKGLEDTKRWQEKGYRFTSPDLLGSCMADYDHIIINDDLNTAIQEARTLIQSYRK